MRIDLVNFHEYLKQKRVSAGMSQLEVARQLGYSSPQFVSNWERGLVSPPLETLATLVDLYKISPSELVERIVRETKSSIESALKKNRKKGKSRR